MFSAPKSCSDCGQPSTRGSRYCEKHVVQNAAAATRRDYDQRRAANDEVWGMYQTPAWRGFRALMVRENVICQRLHNGVQCHNLSKIVHHLISPRQRPELFRDPANVVCLCEHCHPSDEGTPHWRAGVDFVATVFRPLLIC